MAGVCTALRTQLVSPTSPSRNLVPLKLGSTSVPFFVRRGAIAATVQRPKRVESAVTMAAIAKDSSPAETAPKPFGVLFVCLGKDSLLCFYVWNPTHRTLVTILVFIQVISVAARQRRRCSEMSWRSGSSNRFSISIPLAPSITMRSDTIPALRMSTPQIRGKGCVDVAGFAPNLLHKIPTIIALEHEHGFGGAASCYGELERTFSCLL